MIKSLINAFTNIFASSKKKPESKPSATSNKSIDPNFGAPVKLDIPIEDVVSVTITEGQITKDTIAIKSDEKVTFNTDVPTDGKYYNETLLNQIFAHYKGTGVRIVEKKFNDKFFADIKFVSSILSVLDLDTTDDIVIGSGFVKAEADRRGITEKTMIDRLKALPTKYMELYGLYTLFIHETTNKNSHSFPVSFNQIVDASHVDELTEYFKSGRKIIVK